MSLKSLSQAPPIEATAHRYSRSSRYVFQQATFWNCCWPFGLLVHR